MWRSLFCFPQVLLAKGAAVNAADRADWSALMHAAKDGRSPIVVALLCSGALSLPWIVLPAPSKSRTVGKLDVLAFCLLNLLVAVMFGSVNHSVMTFCVQLGASVYLKNMEGHTALRIAKSEEHTEVVKLLIEAGKQRFLWMQESFWKHTCWLWAFLTIPHWSLMSSTEFVDKFWFISAVVLDLWDFNVTLLDSGAEGWTTAHQATFCPSLDPSININGFTNIFPFSLPWYTISGLTFFDCACSVHSWKPLMYICRNQRKFGVCVNVGPNSKVKCSQDPWKMPVLLFQLAPSWDLHVLIGTMISMDWELQLINWWLTN